MPDGSIGHTHNTISFNGLYTLIFDQPVYDWLINNKFKKPVDDTIQYFSNFTTLFHYDNDKILIDEINEIINT